MKTRYLFFLTLLLPLLFTGCGSSNSSNSSSDEPDPGSEAPNSASGSNWDEMRWNQGKWG